MTVSQSHRIFTVVHFLQIFYAVIFFADAEFLGPGHVVSPGDSTFLQKIYVREVTDLCQCGNLVPGGFGLFINLLVGIVGGVLGGWVFSLFGIAATGIIGSLVTSIVGAILLLWIVSLLKRSDIS